MNGTRTRRSYRAAAAAGAGFALLLTGCSSGGDDGTARRHRRPTARSSSPYGDLKGKTVTVYTGIVTPEDTPQIDSYKPFEECTGVDDQVRGRQGLRDAGPGPRARPATRRTSRIVPQPGLLAAAGRAPARSSRRRPAVAANVDKFWGQDWKDYGTVDGKFYAAPLGANVKSLVWYSPERVRGERLRGPDDARRAQGAVRQDRRGRQEAVVRGHRAAVRPPAGRSPTGWRT